MRGARRGRRPGGLPAAGRLAARVHPPRARRARTTASRSASRSSAAAPPGSRAPTACWRCSPTTSETAERLGEVPVAVIEKAKACGGHSLSGAVMRPQPLLDLFPDVDREQWRRRGVRVRRGHQGGRLPAAQPRARSCASRRRRRFATTAPRSSRSRRSRASSSARAEEAGRLRADGDRGRAADRRRRARRRRALGRQGARQGRRAAVELRAGKRHRGAGDGARRGQLGASDRRRDPRVRARRPTASRRSGSSASRRSGGSRSRSTA